MLDDNKIISDIDKSQMIEKIEGFPDQIKKTHEIIDSTNLESIFKIDHIIISGMGASAISGDILQRFFRDRLDIPIFVTREYDLPKWCNKNTLVISQSYSGDTEETLSTFKHAYQKRCKIITISSGGKLQDFSEKRNIPHIQIPSGFQPREAIAFTLFSSILSLKKIGVLKNDIDLEIDSAIEISEEIKKINNRGIPENDNLSKQIAKKIFNNIPQIYGWGIYTPIIRRWCQQLNENSKVIAKYDEIPECNHNDIIGWSMNPEVSKKFLCILFRDEENESIYLSKRLNFMKNLYSDLSAGVIEIKPKGKKRLAKMIYGLYLGDFVSFYLAILRKVDPTPIVAINELKSSLAEI